MSKFFSAPRELQIVIGLLAALSFALSARVVWVAVGGSGDMISWLFAIALFLLAVGLLRLSASARMFTTWVLWFVVIVVPIGVINPFAAINDYAPEFPDVWTLVFRVYSVAAACLVALHFLGKHKKCFT